MSRWHVPGFSVLDDVAFVVNIDEAPGGWDRWSPYRDAKIEDLPDDMKLELGLEAPKKPRIYVAGPMRGLPDLNSKAFNRASDILSLLYDVVNPIDLDIEDGCAWDADIYSSEEEYLAQLDMAEIIKRDLDALATCQYIYMLDGWDKSKGALAEKATAEWHGITVLYQTDPEDPSDYAQERKDTPVYSGVLSYFPDAIRAVARCSKVGNDQHNPGKPMHWDRSKSGDELDALTRHLMQAGTVDTDGILHSTKVAWRALANLQKELENNNE